MNTGEKIRKCRKEVGLSQVKLAELLGVSKQSMYKYEMGVVTNIPYDKVEQIARICHTTPAYLLGWDEQTADDGKAGHDRMRNYFLSMYDRLDDMDKGRLIGNAENMLEDPKYKKKRGNRS